MASGPSGSSPDSPEDSEGSLRPSQGRDGASSEEHADGGSADIGRETVTGISWQAAANLVQFVARFGFSIILARILLPEDFGVVAVATLATGFASTLTDLGLGPALIQRKSVSSGHIRSCFTFSTLAENQLQAMQLSIFFFLPSLLLSGFMFPFRGMPEWAQVIGQTLPLTHFLRIIRGVLLKGNGWVEIWPELWPILAFMLAASALALVRYRRTLD